MTSNKSSWWTTHGGNNGGGDVVALAVARAGIGWLDERGEGWRRTQ
jgi:hypothetical protein